MKYFIDFPYFYNFFLFVFFIFAQEKKIKNIMIKSMKVKLNEDIKEQTKIIFIDLGNLPSLLQHSVVSSLKSSS